MSGGARTRRASTIIAMWLALTPAVTWGAGAAALPAPQAPEIVAVRVGIGDRYKAGVWTSLELTLRGGSQAVAVTVSVTVPDDDGIPVRFSTPPEAPCRLEPGRESRVPLVVRFGRMSGGPLAVEVAAQGRALAQRSFPLGSPAEGQQYLPPMDPNQPWVVVVGGDALGVDEAYKTPAAPHKAEVVLVNDPARLPADSLGYEGVDALILTTSHPALYRDLKADAACLAAIDRWVGLGGRLLLSVGPDGAPLCAPGAPLARFLPGRLGRAVPVRLGGGLEIFCGSPVPLPVDEVGGEVFRAPQLLNVYDAAVEVQENDIPLLLHQARRFGSVLVLAADLDRPPLSNWRSRPMLLRRLLDVPAERAEEQSVGGAVTHFGFVDLAGQLRKALNQFPGVQLVSFSAVVGLVTVYLLLILPADYFFLRRIVGRMIFTWVTFPAVVLAMCVAAWFLTYGTKGHATGLCQADLVDVDTVSGRVRGTTWATVFSPETRLYDVTARPVLMDGTPVPVEAAGSKAAPAKPQAERPALPATPRPAGRPQVLTSWFGLSGTGMGAMDSGTGSLLNWLQPYDCSPGLERLGGLPVAVRSTKALLVQWEAAGAGGVEAELTDEDRFLSGTVSNSLPLPLSHCVLFYGHWAHDLGTLQPGQVAAINTSVKRSELKTYLNGWKIVQDAGEEKAKASHEISTPYDDSSFSVPYILQAMMFYRVAGGGRYVGLADGYQGWLDQSSLLAAGRAILVAQAASQASAPDRPGCQLLLDGRSVPAAGQNRTAVFRFLFGVKPASSSPSAPDQR